MRKTGAKKPAKTSDAVEILDGMMGKKTCDAPSGRGGAAQRGRGSAHLQRSEQGWSYPGGAGEASGNQTTRDRPPRGRGLRRTLTQYAPTHRSGPQPAH